MQRNNQRIKFVADEKALAVAHKLRSENEIGAIRQS